MYKSPKLYTASYYGAKLIAAYESPHMLSIAKSLEDNGTYCPAITHVTTNTKTTGRRDKLDASGKPVLDANGKPVRETYTLAKPIYTTIVEFSDNTKCIMTCSDHDKPDTETAIVNAIVKRMFGKPNPTTGIVNGDGCSTKLSKLAKSAFDQSKAEENKAKQKAELKAKHEALQAEQQAKARERRVKLAANKLDELIDALGLLGIDTSALLKSKSNMLCETSSSKPEAGSNKPEGSYVSPEAPYVRPDKKFSEFTQDERRAYWRNAKRKNSNPDSKY